MAMLTASILSVSPSSSSQILTSTRYSSTATTKPLLRLKCLAIKKDLPKAIESKANSETVLHSFSPLPLLYAAALLPGGTLPLSFS